MINIRELENGLRELGLPISEEKLRKFALFSSLLESCNKTLNLTRIPVEEWVTKHYLDSLLASRFVDFSNGTLIDVGTGAGFPGIPLKIIYPDLKVTFLDATKKKLQFVESACSELDLSYVNFCYGRSEELSHDPNLREKFDLVVSRAVGALSVLVEISGAFVGKGGKGIFYKGVSLPEEIEQGENAIRNMGLRLDRIVRTKLPVSGVERTFVIVSRTSSTKKMLPRTFPRIKKSPL